MASQLAKTETSNLSSIEAPAILMLEDAPIVFWGIEKSTVIYSSPRDGFKKISLTQFTSQLPGEIKFTLPRRTETTPTSRFGWSWFVPLLRKYKKSLVLVFIASLLSQLFGLGIPLLLQQIIDKVLSQGNLSSLNVLGTAMIIMALFKGFTSTKNIYLCRYNRSYGSDSWKCGH